ncbi:methyltransferase family protein [Flagellimonas sp.]|uniref:methyltransferase family protein n=1 Tax=Flagellimonas sp. TaxID=2058762 RepID=UPI003B514433
MKEDYAHKSILRTSDFILTIIIVVGGLVEYFFIWHWSLPINVCLRTILGIVLLLFGISLIVKSKSELDKAQQPSEPGKPTTQIIQTGIYAITRNPTYFGCAVLLLGLGITFNFFTWAIGSLLALILMHVFLVLPEEKYLSAKFPEEFSEYKNKVRRWM